MADSQWLQAIRESEDLSFSLEPDEPSREAWTQEMGSQVNSFYDTLGNLPAYSEASLNAEFKHDSLGEPEPLQVSLKKLHDAMSSHGIQTAGPGHLGFIPGGGLYTGAMADHLAAVYNHFSADSYASPAAVQIHNQVIEWLIKLVGYSSQALGDITSGGTHATLAAFMTARQWLKVKPIDYEKLVVYATDHTHHCYHKALNVLFSGMIQIRMIKTKRYKMDVADLQLQVKKDRSRGLRPAIVVASAGTTNLGMVDPLDQIAKVCEKAGIWFHVDGAYGGFFTLTSRVSECFKGISSADSIVLDPHKGMFLPYGAGALLVKNGSLMVSALGNQGKADYLQDRPLSESGLSPMDYSLELTRPFRSLRIWFALKTHGQKAFEAALDEKLLLARYAAEQIDKFSSLELVVEPELSVFAFKMRNDPLGQETRELLQYINQSGLVFLSSTMVDNQFVIRVAILSHRTHIDTIDRLIGCIQDFFTNTQESITYG